MQLTAENIQNQQFHVRFRGFDVDEVDSFLIKVAENYQLLFVENQRLRELVNRLENEQDQVQSQEKSFKNAIISAQTIADQMQETAKLEATELLNKTEDKVNKMITDAELKSATLRREISSLTEQKSIIKEELKDFLNSYLAKIEADTLGEKPEEPEVAVAPAPLSPPVELEDIDTTEVEEELVVSAVDDREAINQDLADIDENLGIPEFDEDKDLADLYEKIDLPDTDESGKEFDLSEIAIPAEGDNNLPDIDGDLSFSLDDPIDEDHVDIQK